MQYQRRLVNYLPGLVDHYEALERSILVPRDFASYPFSKFFCYFETSQFLSIRIGSAARLEPQIITWHWVFRASSVNGPVVRLFPRLKCVLFTLRFTRLF